MKIEYISDSEQLQQICLQFQESDFLIIDTEFIRQSTYYPILALLQVSDGNTIAIIDPVAISDLKPLFQVCFDPNIVKVLHSARQDMEIFYHVCGKLPHPIFDTQIAAALLGHGTQIGYAALVKTLLGVELDKSQTRTNWLNRPLTPKQLEYAGNDVLYLEQIYKIQKQELLDKDRLSWLQNDFNFLCEQSTYAVEKMGLWKKIRGNARLKGKQLGVLQYLAAWREDLAITKDVPRKRVLSDDILLGLANQMPQQYADLENCQALSNRQIDSYGKQLLIAINKALELTPEEWPKLPQRYTLSQQQDAMADCLMAINHLSAAENNISPNCLCNRKDLEQLVMGKRELNILTGWRYELAGKDLLSFINGESSLSIAQDALLLEKSPSCN